jgi:hypothetical protein
MQKLSFLAPPVPFPGQLTSIVQTVHHLLHLLIHHNHTAGTVHHHLLAGTVIHHLAWLPGSVTDPEIGGQKNVTGNSMCLEAIKKKCIWYQLIGILKVWDEISK